MGTADSQSTEWHTLKSWLCVRLDAMGDVVMTTPAIRAIKESGPDRKLTLLTSPSAAEVAALIPEIDEVIVYEAPWMKASANRSSALRDLEMINLLKTHRFDAAVIHTVYSQSPLPAAMMCFLAGIPRRIAFCRENPYQLLTHWHREHEPEHRIRHEVQRQLDLVATIEARPSNERLRIEIPHSARRRIHQVLRYYRLERQSPWVVLHPGASAPSRRYPAHLFAQVAKELVTEHGFQVVLTGSAAEMDAVREVEVRLDRPAIALAGHLSLAELAALLEASPLLISNNTGPVHLAAAVGTPIVDLYALTNPQHTPWRVPHHVLFHDVACKFCYKSICPEGHHNCLRLVPPAAVVAAALDLLKKKEQELRAPIHGHVG